MTGLPTAEVLRRARRLYAARPSHVKPWDFPESGTYCPVTALARCVPNKRVVEHPAYEALCTAAGIDAGLPRFNAEHTTEEVLAVFDRAIEAAS